MGRRSVWKGPFVDSFLLLAVQKVISGQSKSTIIKTRSRRSTILPHFVGLTFNVYNGKKFIPVQVTDEMVGEKLGGYSPTRTFTGHSANRKANRV
jgi:small subunit ribosomal protein S19